MKRPRTAFSRRPVERLRDPVVSAQRPAARAGARGGCVPRGALGCCRGLVPCSHSACRLCRAHSIPISGFIPASGSKTGPAPKRRGGSTRLHSQVTSYTGLRGPLPSSGSLHGPPPMAMVSSEGTAHLVTGWGLWLILWAQVVPNWALTPQSHRKAGHCPNRGSLFQPGTGKEGPGFTCFKSVF